MAEISVCILSYQVNYIMLSVLYLYYVQNAVIGLHL